MSRSSPPPASPSGSRSASPSASASPAGCVAGHAEVTVAPGDPVERQLCIRPGTVVTLVLRPRVDDRRWTAVNTSAPAFVVVSGWRRDTDGTAHASLRSAGTRGGTARITALAKAPDVAGAARPAFTLRVSVVPYPTQG
ncbi:acetyl-CoA synthetase [Streptomyces gilvus]|uniref:acetyl-CoA synthetase n=1 Tax=Streptomyces gilvus TaxID=2920937 RepID=UPI001F10BB06|nr:acetyl-CoA synthetase [Streptomyces sp. CME 23]MCH5676684.1 acetyl-CoA synthetase [Streptomyces sp. CME 23]